MNDKAVPDRVTFELFIQLILHSQLPHSIMFVSVCPELCYSTASVI